MKLCSIYQHVHNRNKIARMSFIIFFSLNVTGVYTVTFQNIYLEKKILINLGGTF